MGTALVRWRGEYQAAVVRASESDNAGVGDAHEIHAVVGRREIQIRPGFPWHIVSKYVSATGPDEGPDNNPLVVEPVEVRLLRSWIRMRRNLTPCENKAHAVAAFVSADYYTSIDHGGDCATGQRGKLTVLIEEAHAV